MVTAAYSGDAYWQPSTSNVISQTVLSQPATFTMTPASKTLSLTAGATTGNLDSVAVAPVLGFVGTVNLNCNVAYNGSGTAILPTCSLANPNLLFSSPGSGLSSLVTITSVARPVVSSHLRSWGRSGTITLCALALWLVPVRRRRWRAWMTVLVLLAGLNALCGCSGGGNGSSTPSGPVPTTAGTYMVTISATTTAAGITPPAPVTIALTVN